MNRLLPTPYKPIRSGVAHLVEDRLKTSEVPIEVPQATSTRAVGLPEIARVFLKIGAMSYGVGIMGIMQSEVQ